MRAAASLLHFMVQRTERLNDMDEVKIMGKEKGIDPPPKYFKLTP